MRINPKKSSSEIIGTNNKSSEKTLTKATEILLSVRVSLICIDFRDFIISEINASFSSTKANPSKQLSSIP